jgi:hypothetical protein
MSNDWNSHRTAAALLAVALIIAVIAASVTTIDQVITRHASNEAQPGTIGLARPHAPLYQAPGEPVRH